MMTKPTRIAVLLGGLGLFATLPAGATLIVDGLRARAETFAGGVTHSDGPYLTTPTVSANSSAFDGGSNAYSVAWGDIDGFYGARASVHGNGSSSGEFRRTWEITNNTLVPQSYSFSFYIYPGRINPESASSLTSPAPCPIHGHFFAPRPSGCAETAAPVWV